MDLAVALRASCATSVVSHDDRAWAKFYRLKRDCAYRPARRPHHRQNDLVERATVSTTQLHVADALIRRGSEGAARPCRVEGLQGLHLVERVAQLHDGPLGMRWSYLRVAAPLI